ncbi:ATP-binding protein [Bacillus smithii]|uniref:ATP-binding protein n=1 Tax=Bacillus smithii TaxID=1479 RepID=UPI001FD560AB|nr:ATP-binding protein [Bacillus smithii]MED4884407.1 ATP-binding protein [Bacillus smithii]MED4928463.1 ATP-binding protein [Bacillus smithii]
MVGAPHSPPTGALIRRRLKWGKVFGDDVLETAILDHPLIHAIAFNIKSDSYRLQEKKQAFILPSY